MPLTYRTAVRLVKKGGGRFLRHGAEHDLFMTREGRLLAIPRHPGDLSPGVERDIRQKLGLR